MGSSHFGGLVEPENGIRQLFSDKQPHTAEELDERFRRQYPRYLAVFYELLSTRVVTGVKGCPHTFVLAGEDA